MRRGALLAILVIGFLFLFTVIAQADTFTVNSTTITAAFTVAVSGKTLTVDPTVSEGAQECRWDWNNDGTWDTQWQLCQKATKTFNSNILNLEVGLKKEIPNPITRPPKTRQPWIIALEVKNTQGVTDTIVQAIYSVNGITYVAVRIEDIPYASWFTLPLGDKERSQGDTLYMPDENRQVDGEGWRVRDRNSFWPTETLLASAEEREKGLRYWHNFTPYNSRRTRDGSFYSKEKSYHPGEDWNASNQQDKGRPSYTIADGIVVAVGTKNNIVAVLHRSPDSGEFFVSTYWHFEKIVVKPGQLVKAGDKIGEVGGVGGAGGFDPHLHWEIRNQNMVRPADQDGQGRAYASLRYIINNWPGMDCSFMFNNYEYPSRFVYQELLPKVPTVARIRITTPHTPDPNNGQDPTKPDIYYVPLNQEVQMTGEDSTDPYGDPWGYMWRLVPNNPSFQAVWNDKREGKEGTRAKFTPNIEYQPKRASATQYEVELTVNEDRCDGTPTGQKTQNKKKIILRAVVDTSPPALITNFQASDNEDSQSTLTWTNPSDNDLAEVIVRRKTGGYPINRTDGDLVYQNTSPTPGTAVSHVDIGLSDGTTYYYAVFSRDQAGNWNDTVAPGENADTGTPIVCSTQNVISSTQSLTGNIFWCPQTGPYIVEFTDNDSPVLLSNAALTIVAGTEVRFRHVGASSPWGTNTSAIRIEGNIQIQGTTSSPVLLRFEPATEWGGISRYRAMLRLTPTSRGEISRASFIMDVTPVQYGGIAIYVESSDITISNSTFTDNAPSTRAAVGIFIGGGASPVIENNSFNGLYHPILLTGASGEPVLRNNTGQNNKYNGIVIFSGDDMNVNVLGNWIWHANPNFPYILISNSQDFLEIQSGASLTISEGVVVKLSSAYYTGILVHSGGALTIQGQTSNRVVLTSLRDDSEGGDTNNDGNTTTPAPGDWTGIRFLSGSIGSIHKAKLKFGGATDRYYPEPGATIIILSGATVTLSDVIFENNLRDCYPSCPSNSSTSSQNVADERLSIKTSRRDNLITFTVLMKEEIKNIELTIFDLSGKSVFYASCQGSEYAWSLLNDRGQRVANGVYLYVVRVRGFDGREYVSEVRKLVILR
jgi:murein DD-endopeptidase MepM/ murein hydrolase activator NlpD